MTTLRVPQSSVSLATAADALHSEEADRTRAFVRIGWIVAACVALATLALPGDPRIRNALLATICVGVLGSIVVYRAIADRRKYEARMMAVLAFVAVVAGQLGILYVGVPRTRLCAKVGGADTASTAATASAPQSVEIRMCNLRTLP
jgi:hypothetical protein